MTRKLWPLLSFFLLLSGCGSIDWFPAVTAPATTTPTTFTAPTLTAALSPTSIASGASSTLTLTIHNTTATLPALTGLGFVEQLPTGVTAAVTSASQCGGNVSVLGTQIIFISGQLTSGATSCNITANLAATNSTAAAETFTITPANFSLLQGGLVNGVTNQTLTVSPVAAPSLSAALTPAVLLDGIGGSSALTFTINNQSGNPAQSGMGFTEALPTGMTATVATAAQCGGNLALSGSNLVFSGGTLASGTANCTLTADLKLGVSLLNKILADQTLSIKTADFTGFLGTLVNGMTTALTFKILPAAITDSTGVITVSNLVPVGTNDTTLAQVNYTFNVDTANTSSSSVAATVSVVGVDATGAQIASTLKAFTVTVPAGLLTSQVLLNATPFVVTTTDAANISLWRILSVTVP
jgi:mucin-19